jgi:hypothetical protein
MSTELATYQVPETAVIASQDFMPVFDMARAVQRRNMLVEFTQTIMVKDVDYGSPTGIGKPSLLKAGAEKLCTFFGLVPEFTITEQVEDWTGSKYNGEPFFYYRYKCKLTRNGRLIGEGEGSCNTWESKYRYRWVSESWAKLNGFDVAHLVKRGGVVSEFSFAIDKAETTGKYGKPAEYWTKFREAIDSGIARQVKRKKKDGSESTAWEIDAIECRVPNPDVADQVNTCQKMSQKRALVAAVLISVNASEYFTQDIEDLEQIDAPVHRMPIMEDARPKEDFKQNPQTASPVVDVPAEVQEMYRIMAAEKAQGFAKVFALLQDQMISILGQTRGIEAYNLVLGHHGVDTWQSFKSLQKAKQCVLSLHNKITELQSDIEPSGELFAEELATA